MSSKDNLITALNTIIDQRRSCKQFSNQIIDNNTLISILASANKCPSSFGLEPWKILVIKNQKLKAEIQKLYNNQEQIATCSHLFIILTYKRKMFAQDNPWMMKQIKEKRNLKDDQSYNNFYQKNFLPFIKEIDDLDQWAAKQSYILLQTILLVATAHNIASLPMETTSSTKIIEFLVSKNLITTKESKNFNCPFVIALGYSAENYQPKEKKLNKLEDTFIIID